jgi:hypothetical protein
MVVVSRSYGKGVVQGVLCRVSAISINGPVGEKSEDSRDSVERIYMI